MSNEIEIVKQEILEIIDAAKEGGIHPSVYILAPYTTYADLTVTKDTTKVRVEISQPMEVERKMSSMHFR